MTYEELLVLHKDEVKIKEDDFSKFSFLKGYKGLYKNGKIIIDSNIKSNAEKACILVEELGHHYTSYGNILNLSNEECARQEKRARNWGYEYRVSFSLLIEAYQNNIQSRYELAIYLNVTEEFIIESMNHYKEKYGSHVDVHDYTIVFEPLHIIKRIEGVQEYGEEN